MTRIEAGTWTHMQATGRWHFDPTMTEDPADHCVIARIDGPHDELIDEIPAGTAKSLATSMEHRSQVSAYERIQLGNEADARRMGLSASRRYASVFDSKRTPTDAPLVEQLVDLLPLTTTYWKHHRQRPGDAWPMHFDNYHVFDRPEADVDAWTDPGVRRLWIMLTDWRWGQFVQVGNRVWSHWSAGDVLYFDWLVPHGSANCGHSDRHSLLVTGYPTAELATWVQSRRMRTLRFG